ncbi:MAG: SDR family NAD(P)-dependent oxidoreductase [Gammaproteobacteria bacterium]|nr:SDR family NAD(P)-dependent oxidoreductase [Gammaproteobacteria bacterium]
MSTTKGFPQHSIAIIGLAGRFPGANDLDEFWQNVRDGVEVLEDFSDADLDSAGVDLSLRSSPHYVRRGTVLHGSDLIDAAFFGLSPREAQILDPQQRIFLECAWESLEHAGYVPGDGRHAVGVYAGASMNTYLLTQILRNPALTESAGGYQLMLGNDKDFLCTRVSYKLDLHGPSMTIQTACSTSLVAVEVACRALQRGECDLALAGGVSIMFPQRGGYLYQEGMIFSPDGHCRPFDSQARGIRAGAGCGVVVLKRLSDALADRDCIHAVIRGAAINNDGANKAGYTAPSVDGQVEVIATAQMLAGVDPRSIGYMEAHGTGTPLGDPIEIAALTQVFRASTSDAGFCRIGSLKANLGHLDAAAGVASLIKTVLALKHRELPPLVNFTTPNPQLDLERSPFSASAQASPWPLGDTPRRAGVSSFGIGGTNAHVVLEEAPARDVSVATGGSHLLVLSARSASALKEATDRLTGHLRKHPEQSLADVAWTLQIGRQAFSHRCAVVVSDTAQALERLTTPHNAPVLTGAHNGGVRPVAFLFSGQGSQYARMGASLYQGERVYREAVDRCAEALKPHLGFDVREAIFATASDIPIDETQIAQPALFVTEYALAMLWRQWGVQPRAMLGHSIGEYVAAHLAGVMSLDDALSVVAVRGRLMQALPPGSMAAVHISADALDRWLEGSEVEIAAINAPDLCTLSGPGEAVATVLAQLSASGIESRTLHTSHAFHSAMMEPMVTPFSDFLSGIRLSPPTLPYISNVTGAWITAEEATSPAYYARHLRNTVQFAAGVRTLAADTALQLLEVGPGDTLVTLARMSFGKDDSQRIVASLGRANNVERSDTETMLDAAGRLWIAGTPLDWRGLYTDASPRRVPLPTYPFERKRYWVDASAEGTRQRSTATSALHNLDRSAEIKDWFFSPTWMRDDSLTGATARLEGTWLVVGGSDELADVVTAQVVAAGARAVHVAQATTVESMHAKMHQARPGVTEDIARIVSDLRNQGQVIAGAIVLWTLVDPKISPREQLLYLYHAQVALIAGLGVTPAAAARVVVATAGTQSVLDESVQNTSAAVVLGPVLVLPTEVPGLKIRLLDLAPRLPLPEVNDSAAALVAEAAADDIEQIVARRAGRRWLRRFERSPLPPADTAALPLKPNGVYLITGGLGGMGLALAQELAERVSARLLLTARGALPPQEQWDDWLASHAADERHAVAIRSIRAMEAVGGQVVVATADVADLPAMRRIIEQTRSRWGTVDGLIHAAGIAGEGRLTFIKSAEEIEAVLAPKVGGLEVLVDLLGETPLDFVALMSSINSVIGTPGVADYAAANAVLDAFVDAEQCPKLWRRVVALDWGAWREVGMAAKLSVPESRRAVWEAYLQSGIGTTDGLDAFARVLASGRRHVVVSPFDLQKALEAPFDEIPMPIEPTSPKPRQEVREGDESPTAASRSNFVTPVGGIEEQLAAIWSELLGIERVSVDDDFFELGGHSLLATRMLARIDANIGTRLTLRDVFDAPTIRRLALRVTELTNAVEGRGLTADDDREEMEF